MTAMKVTVEFISEPSAKEVFENNPIGARVVSFTDRLDNQQGA